MLKRDSSNCSTAVIAGVTRPRCASSSTRGFIGIAGTKCGLLFSECSPARSGNSIDSHPVVSGVGASRGMSTLNALRSCGRRGLDLGEHVCEVAAHLIPVLLLDLLKPGDLGVVLRPCVLELGSHPLRLCPSGSQELVGLLAG